MSKLRELEDIKHNSGFGWPVVLLALCLVMGLLLGTATLALWGFLNLSGVHVGYYHAMGLVVSGLVVVWFIGTALGFRKRS